MDEDSFLEFSELWVDYKSEISPKNIKPELEEHFNKATELIQQLRTSEAHHSASQIELESYIGLAAIADVTGIIVGQNSAWEEHYGKADKLTSCYANEQVDKIRETIIAIREGTKSNQTIFSLPSDQKALPQLISVSGIRSENHRMPNRFLVREISTVWSENLQTFLGQQYGLSSAEIDLFSAMISGTSFGEIARNVSKSIETIKSQSKSIYHKLQVTNREEAILLALHSQFLLSEYAGADASGRLGKNKNTFDIGDGKTIYYTERGAAKGTKFLYLHGMLQGHAFGSPMEHELEKAGLTAICIDRLGYGRSSSPKSADSVLEEWVEAFPKILDQLGVYSLLIVSQGTGAIYASTAADKYPDRVNGILSISGGIPETEDINSSALPTLFRAIIAAAQSSKTVLKFYIYSVAKFLRYERNMTRLMVKTYSSSKPDKAALELPWVMENLKTGMRLALNNTLDGVISDATNAWTKREHWISMSKKTSFNKKMHYLVGEQDNIILSKRVEQYAMQSPRLSVSVIPGGGHLIQQTHSEAVVEAITLMIISDGNPDSINKMPD